MKNKKMKVYLSVSFIFALIRQFCLPNPFEIISPGIMIEINGSPVLLDPHTLNWIVGIFLYLITFGVAGIYYKDHTKPLNGSILYMVFFVIHSALVELILKIYPRNWLISFVLIAYVLVHVGLIILRNKIDSIYIP